MSTSAIDRAIASIEPFSMARAAMSLADREDLVAAEGGSNAIRDPLTRDIADPNAVAVPYSKEEFARQQQRDPRIRKLLRVRARAVVGLGWYFESMNNTEESPRGDPPAVLNERADFTRRLMAINENAAFSALAECVELDRAATGDGYLEVRRDLGKSEDEDEAAAWMGQVRKLYHVPGTTIRIVLDKDEPTGFRGYVQRRTTWQVGKKVYFKCYGEGRVMHKETGAWADDDLPLGKRATELLHFKNHDPGSDWYGTPEFYAASNFAGLGMLASMRLFSLVRNSPGWALLLKTQGLHTTQWEAVSKDIDSNNHGLYSAGGVLRVNLPRTPGAKAGAGDGSTIQNLGSWMGEAEPLLKIIAECREVLRDSSGFSEIYTGGSAALSRASAQTSRQITTEMEIEPLIRRFEDAINATIMRSWGARFVTFRIRRPKMTDAAQESQIIARLAANGALSVNQILAQLNRLLPDANLQLSEDPACNVPLVVLREMLAAKAAADAAASEGAAGSGLGGSGNKGVGEASAIALLASIDGLMGRLAKIGEAETAAA